MVACHGKSRRNVNSLICCQIIPWWLPVTENPEETRNRRIKEYSEIYENPYCAAERGYIDDVIMPSDTRKVINRALDILEDKNKDNKAFNARPWRKYSNINL